MSLTIRKATIEDADDIGLIHAMSWQIAYKGIIPDDYLLNITPERRAERFRRDILLYPETGYYIALIDENPLGILIIHKCRDEDKNSNTGEIGAIYLHPNYWGAGYGKQIMDFAIIRLKELGYTNVVLWVLEENIRARRFYEKYEFVYDETKKEIVIGKSHFEVRYLKSL
jgi:GNAT superfamily N-acetyltransferase